MKEEIEQQKQLLDILADEVNVKNIELYVGDTENGRLCIIYNRKSRDFSYSLDSVELENKPSSTAIEGAVSLNLKSFNLNKLHGKREQFTT